MNDIISLSELSEVLQDMIDNVPGLSYQDKLNHLSECNCCERHKTNRPTTFIPWYEIPRTNYGYFNYSCSCECRHISRYICRQADGYTDTSIQIPLPIIRCDSPVSIID